MSLSALHVQYDQVFYLHDYWLSVSITNHLCACILTKATDVATEVLSVYMFVAGLTLDIFIEQHEYIPTVSDSAGLRIIIHDQNEMPFPEDRGYNLSPGMKTSIGMDKVRYKKRCHLGCNHNESS